MNGDYLPLLAIGRTSNVRTAALLNSKLYVHGTTCTTYNTWQKQKRGEENAQRHDTSRRVYYVYRLMSTTCSAHTPDLVLSSRADKQKGREGQILSQTAVPLQRPQSLRVTMSVHTGRRYTGTHTHSRPRRRRGSRLAQTQFIQNARAGKTSGPRADSSCGVMPQSKLEGQEGSLAKGRDQRRPVHRGVVCTE